MQLFNEDFLKLYEELGELNEAKADTGRLVAFAGQELADRFLAIKNKVKSPENDLYYWVKNKTPDELAAFVSSLEGTKSNTQAKKDIADRGAELIQETAHWLVYHITTFAASQKYGRDTKWCITGINNYGDRYWNDYTQRGCKFYFLITKGKYDPRGTDSKFAIVDKPDEAQVEIFDQQDELVNCTKIPYVEEITGIPGVDFKKDLNRHCADCGKHLAPDEYLTGADKADYCLSCFDKYFFWCDSCLKPRYLEVSRTVDFGFGPELACADCADKFFRTQQHRQY